MLTKYASAEVLDVKSSSSKIRQASLSKFADYSDYRTDDDYLYVRVRAISSRVNKNHDGWPSAELTKSYRTFIGKPIFVDHHNHDPKRARGVIVDANLHVEDEKTASLDPYYASAPAEHKPPTWIELLLEVDAKRFPKLAKSVINGDIDGVSMGANVERSKCSHCGNWARNPDEYCKHVVSKGAYFDHIDDSGRKTSKKSYEDCYDIGFFEISFVFDPADETALVNDIRTSSVAEEVNAEGEDDHMSEDMMIEARQEFNQAMSEGADRAGAIRAAMIVLKEKGVGKEEAMSMLEYALASPSDLVTSSKLVCPECGEKDMKAGKCQKCHYDNVDVSKSKTADRHNDPPQQQMTTAPDKVDTLRQDQLCPICGSDMEDGICAVCNYEEPPEGFDNPDLNKAKEIDQQMQQQQEQEAAQQAGPEQMQMPEPGGEQAPMPPNSPAGPGQMMAAHTTTGHNTSAVIDDMKRTANENKDQGGRVNTKEQAVLPNTKQISDRPLNGHVVKDYSRPVESNTKEKTMDKMENDECPKCQKMGDDCVCHDEREAAVKMADGASADGGATVAPDVRTDVMGVGGVGRDAEADAVHEDVMKEVQVKAPHTDTFGPGEGDSLGQQEPVTKQVSPDNSKGQKHEYKKPYESATQREAGPAFPDHDPKRVDLMAPIAEPVGPATMTFKKDPMHVGDPVTDKNGDEVGGPMGKPLSASSRGHILASIRVAELETEVGLISPDEKFERAAELEDESGDALNARLDTLSKLKTAGLIGRRTSKRTVAARKLPSMRTASTTHTSHDGDDNHFGDSALFM